MTATTTHERPVVLRPDEVRGILDGTLSEIRRRVRWNREANPGYWPSVVRGVPVLMVDCHPGNNRPLSCPFGEPGTVLVVKEVWCDEHGIRDHTGKDPDVIWYRADGQARFCELAECRMNGEFWDAGHNEAETFVRVIGGWKSPATMPRWACRLRVEVTSVRVERNAAGVWEWVASVKRIRGEG